MQHWLLIRSALLSMVEISDKHCMLVWCMLQSVKQTAAQLHWLLHDIALRPLGRRAVVIAVRGTSSVEDVITDSVAEPERLGAVWLPEGGAEAGGGAMFAHSGIKAAAESILDVRPSATAVQSPGQRRCSFGELQRSVTMLSKIIEYAAAQCQ